MGKPKSKSKDDALGMPHGTANARLRKDIMFYLAGVARMLTCFRCAKEIENVKDFSIEHKVAWEKSAHPAELFFDLNNIAFSHYICNVRAGARPTKRHLNKKVGMDEWNKNHPERNRGKNRSVVYRKIKSPRLDFGD